MKVPQIPPLAGCTPLGISPNGRPYSDIDRELDLIPAADLPFNLAGESQSSDLTAEAEARVRALAQSEARKAQTSLDCWVCGQFFADCVCIDPHDD